MKPIKFIRLLTLVAMWPAIASDGFAQVSTFPQPPPLTPPPDRPTTPPATIPPNRFAPATGSVTPTAGNGSAPDTAPTTPPKPVPQTAATLTSMDALNDKNPLGVGDTISFRVIEDRDEPVTRVVTDTGEVDFPYVGRTKVEGKTCHEIAIELKRLLEIDYYKQATVIVGLDLIAGKEKVTKHDLVWVIGEVRQEGPQEIPEQQSLTVSQVILKAGGFSDYADQRKVRVIHRSSLSSTANASVPADIKDSKGGQTVDVKAIFDGHSSPDPVVTPDDYVIVAKKFVNF